MKNSDDAVERLLSGLREAKASAGMESRILKAVRERAQEHAPHRLRAQLPAFATSTGLSRTRTWAAAAVGLAVLSFAFGWISYKGHRTSVDRQRSSQSAAHGQAPANPPRHPVQLAAEDAKPLPPPRPARRHQPGSPAPASPSTQPTSQPASQQQATASDLHAASFPAPEEPLTQQERLLRRIAHKGDPEELVALNSDLRAARSAGEAAEFQRFFNPPPPPKGDTE